MKSWAFRAALRSGYNQQWSPLKLLVIWRLQGHAPFVHMSTASPSSTECRDPTVVLFKSLPTSGNVIMQWPPTAGRWNALRMNGSDMVQEVSNAPWIVCWQGWPQKCQPTLYYLTIGITLRPRDTRTSSIAQLPHYAFTINPTTQGKQTWKWHK